MKLWEHQERAIELSHGNKNIALFWDPGCGKSKAAIEMLKGRCQFEGKFLRTLIVCPLSVVSNWKKELLLCDYREDQIIATTKSGAARTSVLESTLYDNGKQAYDVPKVVVLNYEALITDDILAIMKDWQPELMIVDESHKTKNPQAKRSKIVFQLAQKARYRYLLTGTPILQSCQDVFQQFKILDLGETFGGNFFAFRHQYFVDKNAGWNNRPGHFPDYVMRSDSILKLQAKMAKNSFSVKKEDCLNLPPLVKVIREAPLSPEQKRLYKEMEEDLVAFLKEGDRDSAVQAPIAMVKALKLQQIVSGFLMRNDNQCHEIEDVPRIKVLGEILEEICPHNKAIIWATFKANYRAIRKLLTEMKLGFVELHGEVASSQRQVALDSFESDPNISVMLANQGSGGIGVNMIAASYSIYYSKNFSLEHDIQSEARNYRGGSERHDKITRIDLVAPLSIDEHVNLLLAKKQAIGDNILKFLK